MPLKQSPMRFAHIMGYTTFVYEKDGAAVISVGYDGDLRVWPGFGDTDPPTMCLGEHLWAVLQHDDRLLLAGHLNTVQAYKYPSMEKDGIVFRFTAYVTSIVKNEHYLVAGSEDATIKILTLKSGKQYVLDNLGGPVISMDVSRKNMLAASMGNGEMCVWNMDTKELLNTFEGLPKVKSFEVALYFVSPSFEPKKGAYLAYPEGNKVIIVSTKSWKVVRTLSNSKALSDLTVCCYSPNGALIAAGNESGEITIWKSKSGKLIEGLKSFDDNPITKIAWNPQNQEELAISDGNGQIGTVTGIVVEYDEDDMEDEECDIVAMAEKEEEQEKEEQQKKQDGAKATNEDKRDGKVAAVVTPAIVNPCDDPDDDNNENCIQLEKLKSQVMGGTQRETMAFADFGDDDDDRATVRSDRQPKSFPQQASFQPGATSLFSEHCYLAYNHVGIVRRHETDQESSIDVEYHSTEHGSGFNLLGSTHTMASLSETVLAIASPSEDGKPSKVVCINHFAFGTREWSFTMPNCEDIIAVAASEKSVIVATDSRFLRIYTAYGTQREIFSVAGPIVALGAYGDHFLVTYHSGPANEDQHITMMMVTCVGSKLRCREVRVPLSARSELRWIGYTDRGSPVVYDSAGVLNLYHAPSNLWMPIFSAENMNGKNASDTLFIIKVSESTQHVQFLQCRGAKYPLTYPKPIPMEQTLALPVCDNIAAKDQLEDELVRLLYLKVDDPDADFKEKSIKLFVMACHNESELRAKELAERLGSTELVPLLIKYASKVRRFRLAEAMATMLPGLQKQEEQEEKVEQEKEQENVAFASELQHINLQAITKKDTTPKIKPLPVGTKRANNPFRKATPAGGDATLSSSPASSPGGTNPLEHLTGKAIGFAASPGSSRTASSEAATGTGQDENRPQNGAGKRQDSAGGNKFLPWFEENRTELQGRHPEAGESELIKIGMREFRTQQQQQKSTAGEDGGVESGTTTPKAAEKRKLDETDQPESGVSKLAKFGFVKNA
ncbi:WD repeat and HMG-box DNA-binding protein 1 [Anopheles bellator]|uniref:WD repeat and HMG-box DNA-binding protein 1 n=1 Tax=Anopheles bellator TaxID=139047 RepID=UPI00264923BA|nr:WD repeat and HMG-box DNA-binding protein 1 [Anopheles bellator]